LKDEAGGAHGALWLGGVTETEKELICLAQLSTGEKKPLFAGALMGAAPAKVDDRAEIKHDDRDIDKVKISKGHTQVGWGKKRDIRRSLDRSDVVRRMESRTSPEEHRHDLFVRPAMHAWRVGRVE
jgi:hypothetical protein